MLSGNVPTLKIQGNITAIFGGTVFLPFSMDFMLCLYSAEWEV